MVFRHKLQNKHYELKRDHTNKIAKYSKQTVHKVKRGI